MSSVNLFSYNLQKLENSLLPTLIKTEYSRNELKDVNATTVDKISHLATNICLFFLNLGLIPFTGFYTYFFTERKVEKIQDIETSLGNLPDDCGFADSLFQTIGLGTSASALKSFNQGSNWDKWLSPNRIEKTQAGKYESFFTDVISRKGRTEFIKLLKEMNVTAYRFSMEWSIIQPNLGSFDLKAVQLYREFIEELENAGIKPYVTLHHFVHPQWFEDLKGFEDLQNIDIFVNYVQQVVKFFPNVKDWITFNEPGVFAFQSYVRGVYPPGIVGNISLAGIVMRNMLIAHCRAFQKIKAIDQTHEVGITHQWLKFEPLSGNFIERVICYFLSKITHYAVYNFFKKGIFSLKVPFMANIHYVVPKEEFKKNKGFLDWIGVQFYGFPKLKIGTNSGKKFPGHKVTNLLWKNFGFSFGSTCNPDSSMMSFGPSYDPESLVKAIKEAKALNHPVAITEIGCDATVQKWGDSDFKLDNLAQRNYYARVLQILKRFNLKAVFFWTWVRDHLEWERGKIPNLGSISIKKRNNIIESYEKSPAASLLKTEFANSYFRKRAIEEIA